MSTTLRVQIHRLKRRVRELEERLAAVEEAQRPVGNVIGFCIERQGGASFDLHESPVCRTRKK